MPKARIMFLDIETTNLNANFGYILCISWKFNDEKKVRTISITDFPRFKTDPTNDKDVVKNFAKELPKADIICGHYSSRFDIPFVNSRLLNHNLNPLPPMPHIDTWRVARYNMKLNSNRLASITAFFSLEEKTPLSGPIWIKAMAGHKPSIRYVVKHCEQDVLVLEQVYNKIRPLINNHPNVNIVDTNRSGKAACPVCGGKVQKRGFRIARVRKSQRYHCQGCGAWSQGASIPLSPKIDVR